jgi:catechol 2,3-dioxygenase-like lactoylglutathione lyase family enzyme
MSIAEKRFHTISQIGIIVPDLEPVVAAMREKLGVEPTYGTTPPIGREYRGEPSDFVCKMAFYRFANIELEIIQPISGTTSCYQDFLDSGRMGLHHIRFSIDDQKGTEAEMAELGFPVYQKGLSVNKPGCTWAFFDTEPTLPFIIETFNDLEFEKIQREQTEQKEG